MHEVMVYSRTGCHLCDVVKKTLKDAQGKADFVWHEADIDSDSQLRGAASKNPLMKARYADLAWDLEKAIATSSQTTSTHSW